MSSPTDTPTGGPPRPRPRDHLVLRLEWLVQFEWLLVLTALITVILVFPLRLKDEWLVRLAVFWTQEPGWLPRWTGEQFRCFLNLFHSPLAIKGAVAGIAMVGFIAAYLGRLCVGPVLDEDRPARGSALGRWAWSSVLLFFGWAALSAAWSPTPRQSIEALYWVVLYGSFIYLLVRRGLLPGEARQLGVTMVLLGSIVMLVLFLQSMPIFGGKIFAVMHRFQNVRNVYGSLMGHNTAVASFLLMTVFPALAFLLTSMSRLRRIAAGLYLALVTYAVLIVQSRAIWLLGPILVLLALRSALRGTGSWRATWTPTLLLGVLALMLVSQLVDRPWNPFFIRDNPLAARLHALSAEGLRREARLRLNVIGLTLVPERPLIGHGLYAYEYIYPKRQGEYFVEHSDTPLEQTPFRSHMAHNEYLQVAIDHGLIGLVLLLLVMAEFAARGRLARKGLAGHERLLHEAFGWTGLAFVLHAVVDFPFHVPQLALPGILALAAWGGLRPEQTAPPQSSAAPSPQGQAPPEPEPPLRWHAVGRLLGGMACLGLAAWACLPLLFTAQSDMSFNQGQGYLTAYRRFSGGWSRDKKIDNFKQAARFLNRAIQIKPSQSLAIQKLAEAYWYLGVMYDEAARKGSGEGGGIDPALRARAIQYHQSALKMLDQLFEEMDYHLLYYQRAQVYKTLKAMEDYELNHQLYLRDLETALRYCHIFPEAAYELAEVLAVDPSADPARVTELRRSILDINLHRFADYYIVPANRAIEYKRYDTAVERWEDILRVGETPADWSTMTAIANMWASRRDRALELARQVKQRDINVFYGTGSALLEASLEGDWTRLLKELKNIQYTEPEEVVRMHLVEREARRRAGLGDGPSRYPRPGSIEPAQWDRMLAEARPMVLLHYFDDPSAARQAMEERLQMEGWPQIGFWLEGYYVARAQGDPAFGRECIEEARQLDPNHPAVQELGR